MTEIEKLNIRLTDEEAKALVSAAQAGDKGALEQLFDSFTQLRTSLVKYYASRGVDADDVEQEFSLHFVASILEYDDSRCDSAIAHLVNKTKRKLAYFYRCERRYQQRFNLCGIGGYFDDQWNHLDTSEENIDLMNQIKELDDFSQKVILHYYFDDMTQQEIADHLGVSRMKVQRALDKSRAKLRKLLSK